MWLLICKISGSFLWISWGGSVGCWLKKISHRHPLYHPNYKLSPGVYQWIFMFRIVLLTLSILRFTTFQMTFQKYIWIELIALILNWWNITITIWFCNIIITLIPLDNILLSCLLGLCDIPAMFRSKTWQQWSNVSFFDQLGFASFLLHWMMNDFYYQELWNMSAKQYYN